MAYVHPRFQAQWLPTAFIGVLGAVLCMTVSLNTLVIWPQRGKAWNLLNAAADDNRQAAGSSQ